jgi:tripartite-type tricarboxylate transporter receptor subunit TctC
MGMVAARGTPESIVRQLSNDLRKVFEKPEIQAKLEQIGTPFRPAYGADFARFIEDEQKLWLPMIRQFNARH